MNLQDLRKNIDDVNREIRAVEQKVENQVLNKFQAE